MPRVFPGGSRCLHFLVCFFVCEISDLFPYENSRLRVEYFSEGEGRELYACSYSILELESCPSRARGLKFLKQLNVFCRKKSCPSRARGLKCLGLTNCDGYIVVPLAGTWIEIAASVLVVAN